VAGALVVAVTVLKRARPAKEVEEVAEGEPSISKAA